MWINIGKVVVLLVVYALFLHFAVLAIVKGLELRERSLTFSDKDVQYRRMYRVYAEQLWEGQRLESDREYQRKILKDTYLYFEPNERPVIVVEE
jgi:hypothetical protein